MQLTKQMRPIEDFIPHVLAATITGANEFGIPETMATSIIRNAAISFADRSGCLTREIEIDLQCGLSEYPIDMLNCETVIGVQWVRVGEFKEELCGCSWNFGDINFEFDDDVLKISPAPTKDMPKGLKASLVVTPNREACKLDEQFYTKWFDGVLHMALSEVYGMAGQPWSSITRSAERRRLFNEEVSRLAVRKVLKGHREPIRGNFFGHPWANNGTRRRRF